MAVLDQLSGLHRQRIARSELYLIARHVVADAVDHRLQDDAATGVVDELEYVSPRSGRAVSRAAAQPYLDKMFVLPQFLLDPSADASDDDVQKAMELTGHFLERRVYLPNGMKMPPARQRLVDILTR